MKNAFACVVRGALALLCVTTAWSQNGTKESDSLRAGAPNVYIDCDNCDWDYTRTEITFVNFVRDRQQADVHILVTYQETASGGTEYAVEFLGRGRFQGEDDTLKYIAMQSATADDRRKGLVRVFKMGLVPFVAKTPLADQVEIRYAAPPEQAAAVKDRWNYWVFEIELSTYINGQKGYRQMNLYGDVEARRVTEAWKYGLDAWGNYTESKYDYENYKVLSLSRSKGINGWVVKSLTSHWSLGWESDVASDTYSNRNIQVYNAPGIEYNIFPYSESTRRQLRIKYVTALRYVKYDEETIYNKTEEWLTSEGLSVTAQLIQPWGSVSAAVSGSHYFFDFKKNYVQLWGNLSLRLVEGLSLNLNGNVSRVRNQLSLAKGDATEDEVLLRRRELETSYDFYISAGLSYTFGSIYNNIVNPRFGD